MTDVTVTFDLVQPNGSALPPGASVLVQLVDAGGGGVLGGGGVIVAPVRVRCDIDGHGLAVLTRNSDIIPAGTFYRCTVERSSPTLVRTIVLGADTAAEVAWSDPSVQALTDEPPTYLPSPTTGAVGDVVTVGNDGIYVLAPAEGGPGGAVSDEDVTVDPGDVPVLNEAWENALGNPDPIATQQDANKTVDWVVGTFGAAIAGTIPATEKGAANGVAELDSNGSVPSAQLPSYVDDVIEVANFAALPATGTTGKIYVTLNTNLTYRWSGSAYVEISASLALGETSSTAYRGDRGKTAYDFSQAVVPIAQIPTGTSATTVPLGNDGRFSDARTPTAAGLAATTTAATSKATPVDADEFPMADSAASFGLKKLTFANLKTVLATVFPRLSWNPVPIRKGSAQSYTSTATLVNDTALSFAIGANEEWRFTFELYISSATNADCQVGLETPSGATLRASAFGPNTSFAGTNSTGIAAIISASTAPGATGAGPFGTSTSPPAPVVISGTVVNGATPGTVTVQHCQGSSQITSSSVEALSTMSRWRIA